MPLIDDRTAVLARMFRALGDPTRVEILSFLRLRCGAVAVDETGNVRPIDGPSFGEVCCHVTGQTRINSTVSFHLNELKEANLIRVEKRGRFMICDVNREALAELADYLAPAEVCACEDGC